MNSSAQNPRETGEVGCRANEAEVTSPDPADTSAAMPAVSSCAPTSAAAPDDAHISGTTGRNTSPNSPSGRGGSATSAAGDRECNANAAIEGPDLTHSLVSRGGTATSAIDGVRYEPLHSSTGVQDQAFPTDSKEREKQRGAAD